MSKHTNSSRVRTATAVLSAAALALLAGCGDDDPAGMRWRAAALDAAGTTSVEDEISDSGMVRRHRRGRRACSTRSTRATTSCAGKQADYAEIRRLLARLDAAASDVVDAAAAAGVAAADRPRRSMMTETVLAADSEQAAVEALFESADSPFADGVEPDPSGAAWMLDTLRYRHRRARTTPSSGVRLAPLPDAMPSPPLLRWRHRCVGRRSDPGAWSTTARRSSDVTALLYLAEHPGVDLRAVTLAGTGESRCEAAIPNTVALLALAGHPDVPVACGRTEPIGPGNEWPSEWRDAADELAGLELTASAVSPIRCRGDRRRPAGRARSRRRWRGDRGGARPAHQPRRGRRAASGDSSTTCRCCTRWEARSMSPAMRPTAPPSGTSTSIRPPSTSSCGPALPVTLVPLDATNDVPVTEQWFVALEGDHSAPIGGRRVRPVRHRSSVGDRVLVLGRAHGGDRHRRVAGDVRRRHRSGSPRTDRRTGQHGRRRRRRTRSASPPTRSRQRSRRRC